ncbi:2-oxo-4-hydroxy-4-carboxy-5-ureidoimidazoline decarboxylase [Streptomyces triticagri]|uniref:2-oxo-4-hydroxy-4-carboxy-5-ureidoimidazoline decarboxylase n=1 Tax=Streptomyces triticagri TaxID=2293568 RepID=UPI001F3DE992|nr:2-oxo-4-hydroxy-4-carboxy-5-ureidoimidazoline decarboxylase [Streptomyces triticagri]
MPAQAHGARPDRDRGPVATQSATPTATPSGLVEFNARPVAEAERALLGCCASPGWAGRIAAHRPYPDLESLLAAADEAGYDLSTGELTAALAAESPAAPEQGEVPRSALTALAAAHGAYESRFGHPFVISLDGFARAERLDQILAGLRTRLGNDPDDERATAAEELRRLARSRLTRLVGAGRPGLAAGPPADSGRPRGPADRPYVPV